MKKLTYQIEINRKKLTGELQLAGIDVVSVEADENGDTYVYVNDQADEQTIGAVVNAHNPIPEIDLLKTDSRNWIENNTPVKQLINASPQQIKSAVDSMTTAQLKDAITFLLILAKVIIKREL